jgi:hypothetical protein
MALKKISEMTPEEMAAELGALREKRDAESATRQMAAKAAAKRACRCCWASARPTVSPW